MFLRRTWLTSHQDWNVSEQPEVLEHERCSESLRNSELTRMQLDSRGYSHSEEIETLLRCHVSESQGEFRFEQPP